MPSQVEALHVKKNLFGYFIHLTKFQLAMSKFILRKLWYQDLCIVKTKRNPIIFIMCERSPYDLFILLHLQSIQFQEKNKLCDWYIMASIKHNSHLETLTPITVKAQSPRYSCIYAFMSAIAFRSHTCHWNLHKYYELWPASDTKRTKASSYQKE